MQSMGEIWMKIFTFEIEELIFLDKHSWQHHSLMTMV